ncbi:serine/threonine-protein phosphatase 4 regulatory subunit 3-like isoform X3 [Carya illinoinensis]|uniref:serine/threonine-protein phosphatase 4 regulatory subunit 3-like isoform X3 n=1 Tax=Carya illinoinensis TaxID=32201 RepID=UPI001C726500|nr:serine/threonine-protein phosphatase 4 regulatory subunit 3-like isoform X3 [Carya illinoinensis]
MGAPEKSQANANSMQRVKVYRLSDDGKWDDQGTGHVSVDYLERSEELGLFVIDEEDHETLLLHRISSDDIYRKQEDTIISWRDPEYSTELALSFQETTGCSYIWDHICTVQRNLHFNPLNNETFHSVNSELRKLPAVELSTLPLILKTVVESGIADQMRLTELILNDQEFFRKLMDLFVVCEDLENIDGLHMIYKIVKGIILLNSPQIFEKIFGDELIMEIIGSLEYDPEVPHIQHHRRFLKEHVVYKEAIPIKDPLVLSKIHQTYRVGYLKDVVLTRIVDEVTVANLNSIIHANNAIVVSLLKDDSTFIQELFASLRSPSISVESKKKLVYFLHEFCSLSKSLQMVQQLRLFRDLMNEGIFDIVADALQSEDKKLVLTGTDILILFLNQDPNLLRSYVVRQEGVLLLGLLVKGMITDFGEDMNCQFLEILRSLLDSYTLSGAQRDTIVEIFYEKHLGQLIDVIAASCPSEGVAQSSDNSVGSGERIGNQNGTKPEILSNICELLCFCVLHHPYRIKCNFLLNNAVDKVLLVMQRREKYLVVAAVRFVRTILSRHDEHLINHIVKNNLLKPIVDAFVGNGSRYNLLNSAVLELFEYIRKENLKSLLKYIVDTFWNQLVEFEYLASIHGLKVKYEQSLENSGTKGTCNVSDPRKRVDERALEKEEEDYFNEDSDEEDTASASISQPQKVESQPVLSNGVTPSYQPSSPRSGGLVDYDDDEDDEDYRPPPRKQPETSDEDEGTMESLRLKRKLASTDNTPEVWKKQRIGKNSKSKDNVFAALCSTLSQAVLPSKKTASTMHLMAHTADGTTQSSGEENHEENKLDTDRSNSNYSTTSDENHGGKEAAASKICSDRLHSAADNRQLGGEDSPLIPPKSSPEMAVSGS